MTAISIQNLKKIAAILNITIQNPNSIQNLKDMDHPKSEQNSRFRAPAVIEWKFCYSDHYISLECFI